MGKAASRNMKKSRNATSAFATTTFRIVPKLSAREKAHFSRCTYIHPFFPHCWVYSIGTYSSTGSKVWRLCFSGLWVLCHCMSCGGDPVLCPKRPKIGLCYSLSSYVKAWVYVPQKSWTLSKQLGSRNINRARAHLIEMSACATRWQYLVLNDVYVGDMVWKLTSAMFWFKTSDNGAVQILKVYILRIQIGTILC